MLRRLVVLAALGLAAEQASGATASYHAAANRIVLKGGGALTLSEIRSALPHAPLDLVHPGRKVWLLRADLLIEDGTVLRLHGSPLGGDVNELRLMSNNRPGGDNFVSITAEHGHLDIRHTRVRSWDIDAEGPDVELGRYGRAFIRVRSKLVLDGTRAAESRMDIIDSEISHLGYGAAESYGLVWKVSANQGYMFSRVHVRGDVINSRIHHNYFGLYSYGGDGGVWRDNEVHSNVQHGINLHMHSDRYAITANKVHHNGGHGLNIAKDCDRFVVRGNEFWANNKSGMLLLAGSNNGLIEANRAHHNGSSGIAILSTTGTVLRNNVVQENGAAGIELGMGTADTLIEGNEIGNNGRFGIHLHKGGEGPHLHGDAPRHNVFRNNRVYGSGLEAVRLADGGRNRFVGNSVYGNGRPKVYLIAKDPPPSTRTPLFELLPE